MRPSPSNSTTRNQASRAIMPVVMLLLVLAAWEALVRLYGIAPYVLPGPWLVATTLVSDRDVLFPSLGVTLLTTLEGFTAAAIGGTALALAFSTSRVLRDALMPYTIMLQVTPVIAIAPLLLIYLPQQAAVVTCAFIVAFFPVLSNTMLGLASTDRNLLALFKLYRASWWQTLWRLKVPTAMPFVMTGLKIAGGLALIGAVVAEIAAGSAGAGSGLAFRIAEAGYRLNIPRMFAALLLLSAAGVVIYTLLSAASYVALRRWHESALREDA